jgi:hypothetical protein
LGDIVHGPVAFKTSRSLATYLTLLVATSEWLPQVSSAKTRKRLVPGVSVMHFVQLVVPVAVSQPPLFNWHHTCDTSALSLAVPVTQNTALLQNRPGLEGEVMATFGGLVSHKTINNWADALFDPARFWTTTVKLVGLLVGWRLPSTKLDEVAPWIFSPLTDHW